MRMVPALALSLSALCGCTTYSTYHPPGRYKTDYDSCLVEHLNFPDVKQDGADAPTQKTAIGQLASLVDAMVSGKAFTRDVYKSAVDKIAPAVDGKTAQAPVFDPSRYAAPSPAPDDLRYVESAPFQQFLDCYLGPVDPIDFDTRLLRGHTALAILAEYAALEITDAPPAKRKDYAKAALSGITDAELALRSGSYTEANQLFGKKPANGAAPGATSAIPGLKKTLPPVSVHSVANVSRIQQLVELGALADSVAVRNSIDGLTALITSAAANTSPTGIAEDVAKGGLKALTATASINDFGAAYFQESALLLYPITLCRPGDYIAKPAMCQSTAKPVGTGEAVADLLGLSKDGIMFDCEKNESSRLCLRHAAWQRWDETIKDACTKLSGLVGNTNTNTCLPTPDQLQNVTIWVQRTADQTPQPAQASQPAQPAGIPTTPKQVKTPKTPANSAA